MDSLGFGPVTQGLLEALVPSQANHNDLIRPHPEGGFSGNDPELVLFGSGSRLAGNEAALSSKTLRSRPENSYGALVFVKRKINTVCILCVCVRVFVFSLFLESLRRELDLTLQNGENLSRSMKSVRSYETNMTHPETCENHEKHEKTS